MKINKKTIIVCMSLILLFGLGIVILNLVVKEDSTWVNILHDISIGVFTGAIVSNVIALIGYFHERRYIIEKTNDSIKNLYINFSVLSKIIGNDL